MYRRKPHNKSRRGCKRYKSKKIKCDEMKPICGGCRKYGLDCEFVPVKQRKIPSPQAPMIIPLRSRSESNEYLRAMTMNTPDDRLLELRLMHHFTVVCAETLFRFIEPWRVRRAWNRDTGTRWVVDIAMQNEGVMDALFAFSAFNLRHADPNDKPLLCASHNYTTRAIAAHVDQVRQGLGRKNTEIVFAGSLMIAFITIDGRQDSVSERSTGLPLHWFQPWQGIRAIVRSSMIHLHTKEIIELLKEEFSSNRTPPSSPIEHTTFDFLLDGLDYENNDKETIEAYERTVRRLSAIHDNPKRDYVFKFAAKVGPRFMKFLEQNDPRTLTIVGYFFMLLKTTDQIWWLPKPTYEEFWTLVDLLPQEWRPRMQWAMKKFCRGTEKGDSKVSMSPKIGFE